MIGWVPNPFTHIHTSNTTTTTIAGAQPNQENFDIGHVIRCSTATLQTARELGPSADLIINERRRPPLL